MFSSKAVEWETPQVLFNQLNKEFLFDVDVCATEDNAKCEVYYDKAFNALANNWAQHDSSITMCWMNPPYGRGVTGLWVKKAHEQSKLGCKVVCLLPARTDTKWFHNYIYKKEGVEIRFIKGRLKFSGHKDSAPFPSMIVIFN